MFTVQEEIDFVWGRCVCVRAKGGGKATNECMRQGLCIRAVCLLVACGNDRPQELVMTTQVDWIFAR